MIDAIAMTALLAIALGSFARLMKPRLALLRRATPSERFGDAAKRRASVIKFALGQWRMPRDPMAGAAHIFIFSGFLVVGLGTVLHFVSAYSELSTKFYATAVGGAYAWLKDIFEYLVILGASYGLWRRLGPTLSRVGRSSEGVFVLLMIFALMVTDFITFGAELHAGHGPQSPGAMLGKAMVGGFGEDNVHLLGRIAFWLHCALVLLFLNFLPLGKHFHVITAIPNVYFRNLLPWGQLDKSDMDAAMEEERFGVRSTADLSWKMVLDLYSCTECGRCTTSCPTFLTDKPLSHRGLNLDLKKALYEDQDILLDGEQDKIDGLPTLVGGAISPETIWACTTCGSCEQECPVFIENIPRIIEMRRHKVTMEADFPVELQKAFEGMERNNNPWGIGSDKRDAWADGLEIPRLADLSSDVAASAENPPLLYWVGCAGSFDDRTKKITLAVVDILRAAKVPFAILGKEECCTGDVARRAGNEYLFQMLAEQNVEILNNYGVSKIVTHCPHCLHTLKNEYTQFGGDYEVVHHTTMIAELLALGALKLKDDAGKQRVAMHDSCYLGRYQDIYEAPREVVRALPGAELVELPRNRSRSVCCGAGGARFWMEEDIGERINNHRANEIIGTTPSTSASACPFCLTMLRDGLAAAEREDIGAKDIAELVAEAIV